MKRFSLISRLRQNMSAAYQSPFVTDGKTARRRRRQAQRRQKMNTLRNNAKSAA